MFAKYSIVLVTLILVFAAATVPSMAQSGRGRQLRIQGTLRGESVLPPAAETQDQQKIDPVFSGTSPKETRRSGVLIYNDAAANQKKDDGEYHMTRADKRAGWILLGLAVLETISMISQD
jgi:hypothetical protein